MTDAECIALKTECLVLNMVEKWQDALVILSALLIIDEFGIVSVLPSG